MTYGIDALGAAKLNDRTDKRGVGVKRSRKRIEQIWIVPTLIRFSLSRRKKNTKKRRKR